MLGTTDEFRFQLEQWHISQYPKETLLNDKNAYTKPNEYKDICYQNNRDKIRHHKNTKHNCDCGGKYTNAHKASHLKTTIHQQYNN